MVARSWEGWYDPYNLSEVNRDAGDRKGPLPTSTPPPPLQ